MSGAVCCGVEVMLYVTGKVEREEVSVVVGAWDGDPKRATRRCCGVAVTGNGHGWVEVV